MGEYAYDFTGENAHDGPSRNPHDLEPHDAAAPRAARARRSRGGLTPLALGSDTNGSIRVPVVALRHIRAEADLWPAVARAHVSVRRQPRSPRPVRAHRSAISRRAMTRCRAPTPTIPAQAPTPVEPTLAGLDEGVAGLRIATLGGYFARGGEPAAFEAVERVAEALRRRRTVELPGAQRARAAAYLITMTEGAALHLDRLRDARAATTTPTCATG